MWMDKTLDFDYSGGGVHKLWYSALLAQMATKSKEFLEFDSNWGERRLNGGRYDTIHFSTMYM